jgi:hypothetical protein
MIIYAFLDESGEFSFHAQSGKYLVFAGIVTRTPAILTHEFASLRYELLTAGERLERFHACHDMQSVRDKVFALISATPGFSIHSIIVRKNKVHPSLRPYCVYSDAYKTMIKYLVGGARFERLHMIVDTVPDRSRQAELKSRLQTKAALILDAKGIPFSIDHHSSASHTLLQVADYCAWAIQRKWQAGDCRSYELIRNKIRNEFDIYAKGAREYY